MHMYMILANYSFQNPYILSITNLDQQISTALLNISTQYRIPILRHPDNVRRQMTDCVAAASMLFHPLQATTYG